jgi:hypothetical protein
MITFSVGKPKEMEVERITFQNDMTQVNHFVTGSNGDWELKGKQTITKENPLEHCLFKLGVVRLRNGLPLQSHQNRVNEIRSFYERNTKG